MKMKSQTKTDYMLQLQKTWKQATAKAPQEFYDMSSFGQVQAQDAKFVWVFSMNEWIAK